SPPCAGEISEGNTAAVAPVAAAPDLDVGFSGGLTDGDMNVGAAGTAATGGAGAAGGGSTTVAGTGTVATRAPTAGAGGAGVTSAAVGFSLVSLRSCAGEALSTARLSFSTLTCGSPNIPSKRPAVFSATRRR